MRDGDLGQSRPERGGALGSGEAVNEHITGDRWPRKDVRDARLRECAEIIRALLDGEEVSRDGLVVVDRARLWTLPDDPPELIGAAVSIERQEPRLVPRIPMDPYPSRASHAIARRASSTACRHTCIVRPMLELTM